ncbi:hypothetical protein N2152v2_006268 [Parachlorella kessleri]
MCFREPAGVVPLRRAVVEELLVQQLTERVRQLSDSELAIALEQVYSGQKQFPAELLQQQQQPALQFGAGSAATTSSTAAPPTPPSQELVPPMPSPPPGPLDFLQKPFSVWPSLQQPEAQQQQQAAEASGPHGPQSLQGASPGSSSTKLGSDAPAEQGVVAALPTPEPKPTGVSTAGKDGQQAEEVDLTQQLFERFAQLAEQQKQAGQQAGASSTPIPVDAGGRAAGTGNSGPSGLAGTSPLPQLEAVLGSLGTWLGSPFAQVLLPRLVGGTVLVVLGLSQLSKLLSWVAGSPSEQQEAGAAAQGAMEEEGEEEGEGPAMPPTAAAAPPAGPAAPAPAAAPTTEEQPRSTKQPSWASWLPLGGKIAGAGTAAPASASAATSSGARASDRTAPPAVAQEQPEQGQEPQPGSSAVPQQPPSGVVWVRKEASPGGQQPQAAGNQLPPPPPTLPNGSNGGPAGAFAAATQPTVAAGMPAGGPILWQRQTESAPATPAEESNSFSGPPVDLDGGSAISTGPQHPSWPAAAAEGEAGSWLTMGEQGDQVAPSGHSSLRDVDLWSLPLEELRVLKADDWLSAQDSALRRALETQPAAAVAVPSTAAAGAAMARPSGVSAASPGAYSRSSLVPPQRGGAGGQGLPSRRHHSLLDNAEPADFARLVPPPRQSNGQGN